MTRRPSVRAPRVRPSGRALPHPTRFRTAPLVASLAAPFLAFLLVAGPALALFTSTASVAGGPLTAGTWLTSVYYLHNRPTPPTGNTTAQVDLAMDGVPPAATGIYRFSTDIGRDNGRIVLRSANGLAETDGTRYVNWRTPVAVAPRTIAGTVTIGLWSQPRGRARPGAMTAYLRDWSAATGTYVELGSATYSNANWATGNAFVQVTLAIPVSHELLPGHAFELRVMVPSTSPNDITLAYDATSFASAIQLP
ncbi:MAG: hypothetical protein RL338_140 [Chloroflexota bacterium]